MYESHAPPSIRRLVARLFVPTSGGLESAGLSDVEAPPMPSARERLDAAKRVLLPKAAAAPEVDTATVSRLIGEADEALRKLEGEGVSAKLQSSEIYALEAVIEVDGSRPVLFVQDGEIRLDGPELSDSLATRWQGSASRFLCRIEKVVASVGGVQLPTFGNKLVGTAFAIAPGCILTNRHVLEEIADLVDGKWKWRFDVEVDFKGEFERTGEERFQLDQVILCGPNPINRRVNFANLDIAVIRVRDHGAEFPRPLSFEKDVERVSVCEGRQLPVYVVGFPAKPWKEAGDDQDAAPRGGHEYQQVLDRLFKDRFGSKRWAPGLVAAGAGQLAGDARKWVMSHDASTLGGNSGSCVVDFANNGERVVGLHFGGRPRVENWAHAMAALQEELTSIEGMVWMER